MWDYRVIRSADVADNEEFSIRRVYYDDDGNVLKCSRRPATPSGDSVDTLRADHRRMMEAPLKPALDLDHFGRRRSTPPRNPVLSFLSR